LFFVRFRIDALLRLIIIFSNINNLDVTAELARALK
tara:strand:- start:430 stop:537 length:108 start_codon:yes stop_codon:yes gene_type:complete